MLAGRYNSGNEDFMTMLYRYSVIMSVLNYSKQAEPPKISDGALIDFIRRSTYTEATERLLMMFAYGHISESLLKYLIKECPLALEDAAAAEEKIIAVEKEAADCESRDKAEGSVVLDKPQIDIGAFESALMLCANYKNSEKLSPADFNFVYEQLVLQPAHILICSGYCYPDKFLLSFLKEIDNSFVMCDQNTHSVTEIDSSIIQPIDYTLEELKTAITEQDSADDEKQKKYAELVCSVPAIRNISEVLKYLNYIDKIYGKDFILHCVNNNIPISGLQQYNDYIQDKKLTYQITAYTKKRSICGTVNHFDYDYMETHEGKIVKQESKPDEKYCDVYKLELSEISMEDTSSTLVQKVLSKFLDKMPPDGIVVQTDVDGKPALFVYIKAKAVFMSISYESFRKDLFDYEKLLSFVKLCSEKHLIRRVPDSQDVQILYHSGGIDYAERYNLTDDDKMAVKNIVKSQMAMRYAAEAKKTAALRDMAQLRLDAEDEKRKTEAAEAQKEADEKEKSDKRKKRNSSGVQ